MKILSAPLRPAKSCIQDLLPDPGFDAFELVMERATTSAWRTRMPRGAQYLLFYKPFEAQSLGGLLPFIRANRSKFPHPVYSMLNYRMRDLRHVL
ncbi:MAG: hypothetical protein WDN50_19030 [Bradyrhizobium sp.]